MYCFLSIKFNNICIILSILIKQNNQYGYSNFGFDSSHLAHEGEGIKIFSKKYFLKIEERLYYDRLKSLKCQYCFLRRKFDN